MSTNGKGSRQRPTNGEQYRANYERVFMKPNPTVYGRCIIDGKLVIGKWVGKQVFNLRKPTTKRKAKK